MRENLNSHPGIKYASLEQRETGDELNEPSPYFDNLDSSEMMQETYSHSNLVVGDDIPAGFSNLSFIGQEKQNHSRVTNRALKISLAVCVFVLLLTLFITIPIIHKKQQEINNLQQSTTNSLNVSNICTTTSCINAASTFHKSLDTSVDPCMDFYKFSCGGWEKKHPLPPGQSTTNNFDVIWSENQAILKALIDDIDETDETSTEWKLKTMFDSCMDLDSINKLNSTPLSTMLEEVGGWSLDGSWNATAFDMKTLLWSQLKYGGSPLVSLSILADLKNTSLYVIGVGESALSLGTREYYLNKTEDHIKVYNAMLDYMVGVAEQLGVSNSVARDKFIQVLQFERELARIMMPIEEQRRSDENYNKLNVAKLQELCPLFEWKGMLQELAKDVDDVIITDEEPIVTNSIDFITNVTAVIKNAKHEVLHNYYAWNYISSTISLLGQPFIDIRNKYKRVVFGYDASCRERWRTCVSEADKSFGDALGRLFVKQEFDNRTKEQADDVVMAIKQSMRSTLHDAKWMDDETTKRALHKVDEVEERIGYPQYIFNNTKIKDDYKLLTLEKSNSYFENERKYSLFEKVYEIQKLRKPVDKSLWVATPPNVNAYYSPTHNNIVFPAGILRPPFFARDLPPALRLGAFGFVIGHELTHGFDDNGRNFDEKGNLDDWWLPATAKDFDKKAKCVQEQYGAYRMYGLNINGELTLGENIADGGGINIAHKAFQSIRKTSGDKVLPSLNYTSDQLFFMSFAQLWCQVATKETIKQSIQTNQHPPSNIRVVGVVSNSEDFSRAFNCSKNSPMNPVKKCHVW